MCIYNYIVYGFLVKIKNFYKSQLHVYKEKKKQFRTNILIHWLTCNAEVCSCGQPRRAVPLSIQLQF